MLAHQTAEKPVRRLGSHLCGTSWRFRGTRTACVARAATHAAGPCPPVCAALIKHLEGRRQEYGMPSPLHLNLRHTYCPGPAAFNHALLRATKQAWCLDDAALWKLRLQGLHISILGFELDASFGIPALSADTSLQNIMDALIKLVTEAKTARDAAGDARPLPLIVIDEANALADWQRSDEVTLRALLRFFVFITKEARLAHVLLATSDTFLTQWLETSACPIPLARAFPPRPHAALMRRRGVQGGCCRMRVAW